MLTKIHPNFIEPKISDLYIYTMNMNVHVHMYICVCDCLCFTAVCVCDLCLLKGAVAVSQFV